MTNELTTLAKKAATVTAVALLMIVLVIGVGYTFDVLMLVFAGVLFAIFLNAIADFVDRYSPLGRKLAIALTVLVFFSVAAGTVALMAPRIVTQVDELRQTLPETIERLTSQVNQTETGKWLLDNAPPPGELMPSNRNLVARITGVASNALGAVGAVFVVFFLGLYLAMQPRFYLDGLIRLVPPAKRERARHVATEVGTSLQWWLFGQLAAMTFIGSCVWLMLTLLGLPFALTLGVLAALLAFIPNFGPIIAAVPAVLIGLQDSSSTALWVLGLYTAIQVVESYILTPLLQQSTVDLPAALTITAQLIMGMIAGGIGLALATPLILMILILARSLYVEDLLGDKKHPQAV
jgi:predicted PurR-regulated permease PerM